MNKHLLPEALLAVATLSFAAPALAEDHPGCGYSQPSWNVPKGAVVFSQGDGPIKAVLNGVGETRTHTMISLGGGRVAHSSMFTPGQRSASADGFCGAPLDVQQLSTGWPGAERMTVAAAYQVLSGKTTNVYYQRGAIFGEGTQLATDWGAAIASKIGTYPGDFQSTAATTWASVGGFYVLPFHYIETLHPYGASRPHSPYSLYQYRTLQNVNHGTEASSTGLVCSTFLAHAQHVYGQNGLGFGLPFDVSSKTYTHAQTVAAGYALYDAVKQQCHDELGFWGGAWAGLKSALWCGDVDLCDEAAAQVRNCMSYGDCENGDPSRFDGDVGNPYYTATSISPDWLGGWVSGQNYWAPDQSVWAWDGNNQVTFSGAGNVYDCWY